jgi:pyruvate/2-oxoacid:ferredoxin oxidoreductase beta subunit
VGNSLFEDNAEFGLGFRLTVDQHRARVMRLLEQFAGQIPPGSMTRFTPTRRQKYVVSRLQSCVRRFRAWRALNSC